MFIFEKELIKKARTVNLKERKEVSLAPKRSVVGKSCSDESLERHYKDLLTSGELDHDPFCGYEYNRFGRRYYYSYR